MWQLTTDLTKLLTSKKKKGVVRWDFEGPISSGYLAHCSHPFFMSIRIGFSASYSMLSRSFVTPTSLARLFINPEVHVTGPPIGFRERKVYHNFVLILYNFVHQVPNFVQPSLLYYRQFKFGGLVNMQPPPPNAVST